MMIKASMIMPQSYWRFFNLIRFLYLYCYVCEACCCFWFLYPVSHVCHQNDYHGLH